MTATYYSGGGGSRSGGGRDDGTDAGASSYSNKAMKGYMCELEKRYGRIPLSPDNARIPLSLSAAYVLNLIHNNGNSHHDCHYSPYSQKHSLRGQSRWSNSSPVSSAIVAAVHLSSTSPYHHSPNGRRHSSNSNGGSYSNHHGSLHSHMDGSDRFGDRTYHKHNHNGVVMEDSVPTPPLASSSRKLASRDGLPSVYADDDDDDYDEYDDGEEYDDIDDDNEQEEECEYARDEEEYVPGRGSTSSSPRSSSKRKMHNNRSRQHNSYDYTPSSPTNSNSVKSRSSTVTTSSSSSSSSSSCRWEALVDDNSGRRGGRSSINHNRMGDSSPSLSSPTKPSRNASSDQVLATLKEAMAVSHDSSSSGFSSSGSSSSSNHKCRAGGCSSRSRSSKGGSSSSNAKLPIRREDKDRNVPPPRRSSSSSPTSTLTEAKSSLSRNAVPPRRVPDVFLQKPY